MMQGPCIIDCLIEALKPWWKKMEKYGSFGSTLLKIVEAVGVRWKHSSWLPQPRPLCSRSSPSVVFSGCPRRKLIPTGQIYWKEKGGTFLVRTDSTNSSSTPFLIETIDWLSHSEAVNMIFNIPLWKEHGGGGHFRPPQNEFAWNILGSESLWWQTDPTLNQGGSRAGEGGEGRNYARIRGDIPQLNWFQPIPMPHSSSTQGYGQQ